MKFSEMQYVRPDLELLKALTDRTVEALKGAKSAQEQMEAYYEFEKAYKTVETMANIAYIRHTIDTRDEFYTQEQDWLDGVMPELEELNQKIGLAVLASPFRKELEEMLSPVLFKTLEVQVRSFKPELIPLMAEENRLTSQYQKLYASARVDFDGKVCTIAMLGPYKLSPDREVRRAAYEAEGSFFDAHREELDELYDKLVKNRTQQAKLMGYENFLPLGYDRMSRISYGPAEVEAFRRQVVQALVPVCRGVKANQARRLDLEGLKLYDDMTSFPDGNAVPMGTADDILAAGLKMYHELSPETAEFIDFMYENELLDVLAREGKAPGGYCTSLPDYDAPFIFSNFNGTAGDVDVLTHEAGHAFAGYRSNKMGYIRALQSPSLESCECHSMSMEFLTQDYHKYFFGEQTAKYEVGHCEDSLCFIPYGCLVDEFQHRVYEDPDMTPRQRNELWASLEKKYRPWIDFEGIPFYGRGAGWQRQTHIYQIPFYYIDYCLAQSVAFQFWMASLADRDDAWKRYLAFADKGGTCTFEELVESAGLQVPYEEGCLAGLGQGIAKWLEENPL